MEQFKLDDLPFPLFMKEIMETRFSGIVFLANEQWKKGLIFNEGRLCAIQSNKPDELLGSILIEMGKITPEQNAASLERARSERIKQGFILQSQGQVQAEDINGALHRQIEKRLLDIFTWKNGSIQKTAKIIDKTAELGLEELAVLVRRGIMEALPFAVVVDALSPWADAHPKQLKDDLPKDIEIDIERIGPKRLSEILLFGPDIPRAVLALYCTGFILFEESQHKALIDQLRQTWKSLSSKDAYAVLDVDQSISEGGLKRAYIKMVKLHHPDAYAFADDPEVKRLANDIFTIIHQAYSEINRIREGKPAENKGISEDIQAELLFAQATTALKAKDYQKALDLFRLLVSMRPNERVFTESYVKTLFMKWQKTGYGNAMEIKATIHDAAKRFPQSDALYLTLGWVLKQEGSAKAVEAFRKALQINPQNTEAQRELRLYQMRSKT